MITKIYSTKPPLMDIATNCQDGYFLRYYLLVIIINSVTYSAVRKFPMNITNIFIM